MFKVKLVVHVLDSSHLEINIIIKGKSILNIILLRKMAENLDKKIGESLNEIGPKKGTYVFKIVITIPEEI